MAGSDCSTSCVNGLRNRPFRCGPGVATRRDKAEPSQVPVLDVQACVSSLTPQSPTTARQKRRRRCCLRPMGKPRHSRLCIFSVLNSSAHLPRCRRFTARLATSRARLAELRGVACSFAVEDLHLLPKHQLAWRNPGRDGRCRPPPGQIRTCALTHTAPPSGQTAPTRCRSRVARVTPNAGAVSRQCRASPASPPVRPFAPSTPPRVSTPLCSPPSSLLWPDLIARPRASTDYGNALSVAVPAWQHAGTKPSPPRSRCWTCRRA